MPLTPGTLSDASPISDKTSKTFEGSTENFSLTSLKLTILFFMASNIVIFSSINCIKSLSEETITTSKPSLADFFAIVAIMSSASKPIFSRIEIFKASADSRTIENCGIKSSGQGGRLALYSG